LCLLGLGNVNRRLVHLLEQRCTELRDQYQISWRITGIASRRLGWLAAPEGFDPQTLAHIDVPHPPRQHRPANVREWLRAGHAHVLFEATSLNAKTGQPAIDHIRAALELGAHAITANKGPVVHAYEELRDLAAKQGRRFLFESTVMDGVPIFAMFRQNLPLLRVNGFRGILNSTTNVVLTGMEEGLSFEESLKKAQAIGVAETDPSNDVEGWDAAVKVAALVRAVMGVRVDLSKIDRHGIQGLTGETVRAARAAGHPYKLVCRASRNGAKVDASVRPEEVPLSDPLAHVAGTSSIVYFETDMFPGLAITEIDPGLDATAYGMLADFISAVGKKQN
jgi:homoserine dehydrogenase